MADYYSATLFSSARANFSEKGRKIVTKNWRSRKILWIILVLSFSLGQGGKSPRVASVFAILTDSVESKKATVGRQLILRTVSDVVVEGEIVIPRESKILGHVTQVIAKGKNGSQSAMAVVIDKAVKNNGPEISVQAIIAAVAAPKDNSLSSDPTYGMMRSNEPKMVGARPSSAASSGELSSSSKAASTAAVATAELNGRMEQPFSLDENSQGAIGYEGVSLAWGLAAPPPFTIFTSKNKNLKLEAGTQMLLRMVPPQLPK